MREEVELLEHHADPSPHRVKIHVHVGGIKVPTITTCPESGFSSRFTQRSSVDSSGAGGPDEADHLAGGIDGDADPFEHFVVAEGLMEVLDDDAGVLIRCVVGVLAHATPSEAGDAVIGFFFFLEGLAVPRFSMRRASIDSGTVMIR